MTFGQIIYQGEYKLCLQYTIELTTKQISYISQHKNIKIYCEKRQNYHLFYGKTSAVDFIAQDLHDIF